MTASAVRGIYIKLGLFTTANALHNGNSDEKAHRYLNSLQDLMIQDPCEGPAMLNINLKGESYQGLMEVGRLGWH